MTLMAALENWLLWACGHLAGGGGGGDAFSE